MKMGRLYSFNILQIVGLGVQFWNWKAGCAVILGGCLGEIAYISSIVWERRKFKPCPKCGACVPERVRLCPECGYQFETGLKETEILDHIEREWDRVEAMTSQEIDCNFEKSGRVCLR